MADITKRVPGCNDEGGRGERGHRGHRGPRGERGPQFEPARTLFVAQVWPAGSDPAVFFTTITDALAQVATMSPEPGNPVAVIIYPGTYTEDNTIPSWVFLSSGSTHQNAVTIDGTVTWTPTGDDFEVIQFYWITVDNGVVITTTGKSAGQTTAVFEGCFLDALVVNGRSATGPTRDFVFCAVCVPSATPPMADSCLFEWVGGRVAGMTFTGACVFRIVGSTTIPGGASIPWSVNGTSQGICSGSNFSDWALNDTADVTFGGCTLTSLAVAAGATADVRSSECPDAGLSGPGTINRRSLTTSFGPTLAGANAVTFAVPFPDASYNVALQLTAGPGNAAATVTAKTGAGFTINDVAGNTYDITVVQD